jgi:hypothetical protein
VPKRKGARKRDRLDRVSYLRHWYRMVKLALVRRYGCRECGGGDPSPGAYILFHPDGLGGEGFSLSRAPHLPGMTLRRLKKEMARVVPLCLECRRVVYKYRSQEYGPREELVQWDYGKARKDPCPETPPWVLP